ncbi:hypothetical protein X975_21710, partial [Stegodyphus mimosarum]
MINPNFLKLLTNLADRQSIIMAILGHQLFSHYTKQDIRIMHIHTFYHIMRKLVNFPFNSITKYITCKYNLFEKCDESKWKI